MNLRQHKHFVQAKMAIHIANRYWQGVIDTALDQPLPGDRSIEFGIDKIWQDLFDRQAVRQLVEPDVTVVDSIAAIEEAAIEYVVAKVSTGEVVGTFDLKEDAIALIDKHHRNKKAKLCLVGGEPMVSKEHSGAA